MQGVRASITEEQTLRWEPFRLPKAPGRGEVLVRIERTIISAGTELANYTGLEPDTRIPGRWCTYPWAPGYGGIGRVLAVGPEVETIEPGQRVYGIFNHASHAVVDTRTRLCVPVPDELDSTTAAFVRMANVAITAYRRAEFALDDGVLIVGLGLVGNLAGQFFARGGARVLGLDLSSHRRAIAEETGFSAAIPPAGLTTEKLTPYLRALNSNRDPRVVVDAVGDSRIVETAVEVCAPGGQVILLGTPRASYVADSTPMLSRVHKRGIDLKGALEWIVPLLKRQGPGVTTEANAELILRMLAMGELSVQPLLSHVLPPAELNDAYQGLLHRKDEYLGVVLDWENNPPPVADA